jgi:hypothetical protein
MIEETYSPGSTSVLDKLDWRKEIHRHLARCIDARGTNNYIHEMERTIAAIAANYSGWDAYDEIHKEIKIIEDRHNEKCNEWIEKNASEWGLPWIRVNKAIGWKREFCDEVFDYLKNLAAFKRMLLWGVRTTPGGTQMED